MAIAAMWEARTEAGRGAELAEWVHASALPAVVGAPGLERVEVFAATGARDGDRVVVIALWTGSPVPLPDPPAALVARPPHAWSFERLSVGS
ncbi:hypothetical protein [Embleya scabrispora]|uniref:hypothetical protein n=1 Tax=Embleya scabrispora TaxID=159449 RepID=UPI00035FDB91|nr:hypothetical protein [Embleya scabrispora]MYS84376.1 hypothetical protein [Streptomyces sp. SID5474]